MSCLETKRVLKAEQSRQLSTKIAFNFEDLQKRCDDYLNGVRKQAQQLIHEARAQAETIKNNAFAEAKQKALQEAAETAESEIERRAEERAEQKASEKLAALLPVIQKLSEELACQYGEWTVRWENEAIRLSAAIAKRIIQRQVLIQPDAASSMIQQALKLISDVEQLEIRLHPTDLQRLEDHAEPFVKAIVGCRDVTFVPDESLGRGSCVAVSKHGTLDARLDTLVDQITEELIQETPSES